MFQQAFYKTKDKIDKLSENATGKKMQTKPKTTKEDNAKSTFNKTKETPWNKSRINKFNDRRRPPEPRQNNFKNRVETGNKFTKPITNEFKKKKKPRHRDRIKTNETTESKPINLNKTPDESITHLNTEKPHKSSEDFINEDTKKELTKKKKKPSKIDEIKSKLKEGEVSEELKQLYDEISKKRKEKLEKLDKIIVDGKEMKVVNFRDYRVTKEDADRLKKLKKSLIKQGVANEEMQNTLKTERKKAEQVVINAANTKPPKVKKPKTNVVSNPSESINDVFCNIERVNKVIKFDD